MFLSTRSHWAVSRNLTSPLKERQSAAPWMPGRSRRRRTRRWISSQNSTLMPDPAAGSRITIPDIVASPTPQSLAQARTGISHRSLRYMLSSGRYATQSQLAGNLSLVRFKSGAWLRMHKTGSGSPTAPMMIQRRARTGRYEADPLRDQHRSTEL